MPKTIAAMLTGLMALLVATAFAQEGRKITGVVETAAGRPVSNALVSYAERGREPQTTRTDSKGKFEISDARRGVVTVTARGFGTARRGWPTRTGGELRFGLTPPARIAGTMADAVTRRGAVGVVTVLARDRYNLVSASEDANTSFEFDDLPPGPAVIYTQADGFAPYFGTVMIEAGKRTDVRLGLLLEAVATGQVLENNGAPVLGARVHIGYGSSVPGSEILIGLVGGLTTTVNEGLFRISSLVPDTPIALQATTPDGRRSDIVTVTITQGMERSGIVLRMP